MTIYANIVVVVRAARNGWGGAAEAPSLNPENNFSAKLKTA